MGRLCGPQPKQERIQLDIAPYIFIYIRELLSRSVFAQLPTGRGQGTIFRRDATLYLDLCGFIHKLLARGVDARGLCFSQWNNRMCDSRTSDVCYFAIMSMFAHLYFPAILRFLGYA